MKIYTRTGDTGMTSLASGERVPKNSPRVEAYGTLDELNSWLGVLRSAASGGSACCAAATVGAAAGGGAATVGGTASACGVVGGATASGDGGQCGVSEDLKAVQVFLMEASSHLASATVNARLKPLDPSKITWLEERIDALSATLPPQTSFLIPGGSREASFAHVARTVARRAERLIAAIADRTSQDETALAFVNRLADYLFVLARHLCISCGVPEEPWI